MVKSRIESLFVTPLYHAALKGRLNRDLETACLSIAREDAAGRGWCREHGYKGYTSYASLDDLPQRASVFAELDAAIAPHARRFARALDWEMTHRRLLLDSLWINVMEKGSAHSGHIHPQSVISGTYYVTVPAGAAALRFEDPRLAMMMAAPPKRERATRANSNFVTVSPRAGSLLLWESFIRHEVPPNTVNAKRISISFNYALR